MTSADKLTDRIEAVRGLAVTAWQVAGEQTLSALSDTERALKRAIKRAEAAAGEGWERVEVVQQRGPTLGFNGRLLASQEFATRGHDPMRVVFEIWETTLGALVAISETEPAEREGIAVRNACVAKPEGDVLDQRLKVMDHFQFHDRARTMARKLGWNLLVEVD